MSIFGPKRGTPFNRNNLIHATEGIAIVAIGERLGGKKGATIACVGVAAAFAGWELLNTRWPKGPHMKADYKGFLAGAIPAIAARLLIQFVRGKKK